VSVKCLKSGFAHICLFAAMFMLLACEKTLEVDPNEVAGSFYTHLKNKDFEAASQMLSEGILGTASRQRWIDFMANVQTDLGGLKNIRIRNVETNTVRAGRMFTFDVSGQYENGNSAETLTLFQSLSASDLEIVSYVVKANGLKAVVPY